jgi:ABC-type glycerol-3-phosphate transport system permease component
MATDMTQTTETTSSNGTVKTLGILTLIAGIVLVVAGAVTWIAVTSQLSAENITVSDDAEWFAGDSVDGPLTAFSEADVINKHALEATGGLTYAELDREDPTRNTAMTASFLRASLFTSVVAYGVAAMAMGIGLVFGFVGTALMRLSRA